MGDTSADVQREIEELRKETTLLVVELESRMKDATNVRAQVRRHPAIAAGVGLALFGGLAFAGYAVYERTRAERNPSVRLSRRAAEIKQALSERSKEMSQNLPEKTHRGGDNEMLKRVLYAATMAAAVALATYMARRVVSTIWTKAMQEDPPGE